MDRRLNVFVNNCATDGYNFGDDSSSDEEAKRLNITYYSTIIHLTLHLSLLWKKMCNGPLASK